MKRDSNAKNFYSQEDLWLVTNQDVFDANKQIEFVNNHLRTDVKIKFTFTTILLKNLAGLLALFFLASLVKYLYEFLLNQWVWFFIAIAAWIICTGGLVYGMINNMPWFKFERDQYGMIRVAEYFMRGMRGQWSGEGYIVSTLTTAIGLTMLYMNTVDLRLKDKHEMRMHIMTCLFAIFVGIQLLLVFYRIKQPWYNPGFFPPDYYTRGSVMSD